MPLTPVEIRHVQLRRSFLRGYRRRGVDELLNEVADSFEEVWREHRSILQAILDGDAEGAERSSRDHQLNTARRIVRSLGYEGEI